MNPLTILSADGTRVVQLHADANERLPVAVFAGSTLVDWVSAFGTPVSVGVYTPLMALTRLAKIYQTLTLALVNQGSRPVTIFLDPSSNGTDIETGSQQKFTLDPGAADSLEIQGPYSRPWVRVAAQSSDGTPCNIRWALYGVVR